MEVGGGAVAGVGRFREGILGVLEEESFGRTSRRSCEGGMASTAEAGTTSLAGEDNS